MFEQLFLSIQNQFEKLKIYFIHFFLPTCNILMEEKVLTALEWYVSYIIHKLLISSKKMTIAITIFFKVISVVELYDLIIYY